MTLFGCAVFCYIFIIVLCYNDDSSNGYHYQRAFPQEVMVDVINNFGLALLEAHNEDNGNNIALSPYGATSVLVALAEGIRGYGVKEIQETTRIPLDISVVRVGLRDIHRHLKSYFIPKEGFLAGLTLSNERVPLIPRYEEILRFYGYDSESFNNPLYPDAFANTSSNKVNYTTSTMTTPPTNQIAIINNDVSTTMETPSTMEFRIEVTEPVMSTTVNNIEDKTMDTLLNNTTIIENVAVTIYNNPDNLKNITISTTTTVNTTPSSTSFEEINFTTMKSTTPKVTTTTASITSTLNQLLTNTESTSILDNSSDNIVQENLATNMLGSEISTVTASETSKTSLITTPSMVIKDVEPLTVKGGILEQTESPIQTTMFTSLSNTTDEFQEAFELADMVGNDSIVNTSQLINSFTTVGSEITESTIAEGVTNTTLSIDSYTSTTSNIKQDINTITNTRSVPTSTTYNKINDITTSTSIMPNLDNAFTQDTSTLVTNFPQDEFSVTTTDSSSEVTATTNIISESITEVTTTSASSSDFTTTVEDKMTTAESIGTNIFTTTESLNMYSTNVMTTDAISIKNNAENSTNKVEKEEPKRGARSVVDYVIARYYDNFPNTRDDYERSYKPEDKPTFLVYGRFKEANINFMTYDAVLPIAYIPTIDALALSFPLDSKEYYLLLLLPIHETGIDRLIYGLKRKTSLRNIINSLRYAHVKAIIPSFMLKGYVVLTPTLQKLGIRRIFEPRHTDFSPMTKEKDIYVTNIEQAVTVTIRNYVDPENLPNYRNLQQFRPIEFKANHPFLYFVMDTDIHVNLMAGKIVNPLNSRIR